MTANRTLFLFSLLFFLSCGQENNKQEQVRLKEKELQLKEKELELKERETRLKEQSTNDNSSASPAYAPSTNDSKINATPISNSKYCYVYVETNEPEEAYSFGDLNGNGKGMYAKPKYFNYKSSVIEVKNYSEDEKYRLVDKFEQQVRDLYEIKNMQLAKLDAECKILSSECFVFDSYKAASEHRRKK